MASETGEISISADVIRKIFGNIDAIIGASAVMLSEFERKLSAWSDTQIIGDVLLKYGDLLKVYTMYARDQKDANEALEECNMKTAYQNFVRMCMLHPLNGTKASLFTHMRC